MDEWVAPDILEREANGIATGGATRDPAEWVKHSLRTAYVVPWLGPRTRRRVEQALASVLAFVTEDPEAFVGATYVAADLRALEYPDGTGELASALVRAFEHMATDAIDERARAGHPPSDVARRALARAFERVGPAALGAAARAIADEKRAKAILAGLDPATLRPRERMLVAPVDFENAVDEVSVCGQDPGDRAGR